MTFKYIVLLLLIYTYIAAILLYFYRESELDKDDKLVPELKVKSGAEEILDELQADVVPDRQITSLIDQLTRKY